MIAVEALSKDFGRTRAVQDVSFHVGRGEVIGLLGPNGSGKTTIMRVLTGFFPPTAGRVWVAGLDIQHDSLAARAQVGYLPERAVWYPDMRVEQFLEFCADVRQLRGPRRNGRIEEVVETCGLTTVRRRLISQLSKGYQQRVGLAQALLHEPPVLILDEPTVGLDPRQIIEIRKLIRSLRGRTTVLLSSHILPEVSSVCDRVVIIDGGRVVAEDTAEGLARSLQEGERILVRVEGPLPSVLSALQVVPGVERIELETGDDGEQHFVTWTRSGESVRAAIAAAIVGRGWALIEIRPLSLTLEDLFMRLVTKDSASPSS